jgi:murein DD-endopeptidase MepM/ murein hydrolase activator NlpD
VLVVRSDGSRAFRANLPRQVPLIATLALAAAASMLGAAIGEYVHLRQLQRETHQYPAQLARARTVIDTVNRQIADLGKETDVWRDVHARIWAAVGPGSVPRLDGIGGGVASGPAASSPSPDLDRLIESVKEEAASLRALEAFMARAGRVLALLPSRWPIHGDVNSEFGPRVSPWSATREFHTGLDIRAATGTAVRAPAAGLVAFAGAHPDYGLTVVIDHGQEIRSVYGHLSRITGRPGDKVERGALVGFTGNTGRSSGPHLHYEILARGRPVNPRAYLWD